MPRTFFWENLAPEKLWYLVGLITSDGCLSPDGRHIDITAKDKNFLEMISKEYAIKSSIYKKWGCFKKDKKNKSSAYRILIGSKDFYKFLLKINLTPKKSLTLGALKIPNDFFDHFLRGVIDGDGCIRNWIHPKNGVAQWIVKISSGSKVFLHWLSLKIEELYGLSGTILAEPARSTMNLKFGKLAAQKLLGVCYCGNNIVALPRKMLKAKQCIATKRGWSKSKTVKNLICPGGGMVDTQDSFGSPL